MCLEPISQTVTSEATEENQACFGGGEVDAQRINSKQDNRSKSEGLWWDEGVTWESQGN